VKIPWNEENPVGGTETPVLGELISPKNSKIPWRNQGITNRGLGVTLTVVLEREREVRKMVKGSVLSRGLNPWKPDSPVSKTRQSGFSWTTKISLSELKPFSRIYRKI
jgi:hypothetical protein